MPNTNIKETISYGYITSRGAVAQQFDNKERAEQWYENKQDSQPTFAASLKLVRITSTVKIEEEESSYV